MAKRKQQSMVRDAVQWAADNKRLVAVPIGTTGKVDFQWDKAETPPPSELGKDYLEFAINNPTAWMKDVIPRHLGIEEEMDISLEEIEQEKKSIQGIRKTLAGFVGG